MAYRIVFPVVRCAELGLLVLFSAGKGKWAGAVVVGARVSDDVRGATISRRPSCGVAGFGWGRVVPVRWLVSRQLGVGARPSVLTC
jgi:hypothetical protein